MRITPPRPRLIHMAMSESRRGKKLVITSTLAKAIVPGLPFENVDASPVYLDTDYSGNKRNSANPSPGPFEILKSGKQLIKVW